MTEDIQKSDKENLRELEMREHGIKRIPIDYFHINGFRYTDLKDAVAQSKRTRAALDRVKR